ncbi:DUF4153 domain-containing protein [Sphingosinicella sp. CPCC 101087]|uniref:DUF4153 domain-containing protein n=1 Tax=Sphingosinicella sp. CPCC 101087 TaxID=2497754 RepID=UPI00101DA77C|nr:DUF4173 domain-containing protein [Sphingosinicella sp. CPCC 101087]
MPVALSLSRRHSFRAKVGAALALILLADFLFFLQEPGWTIGLFALAWAAALAAVVPAVPGNRPARLALALAFLYAALLVDDPDPLGVLLFGTALSLAALLPRRDFDDAWRWALRLILHGVSAVIAPFADLARLSRLPRPARFGPRAVIRLVALPIAGSLIFLSLFAAANPLIESALAMVRVPQLDAETFLRIIFWALVLCATWPMFRPRAIALRPAINGGASPVDLPSVSTASIALSLAAFNLLFAVQNGLDLLFLWSGAPLPEGVTLAEYAHRGAYPLIATALLAGLFVLVTLRPGSETAQRPMVRRLVVLWVGQNLLLVASSILRTIDYVEAYSLTVLRLAALAWMALVAVGLMLICWRMLRERSGAWLINNNALAAAIVLSAAAAVDLGSIAAEWNVRHAREVDATGAELDLCYLRSLGPSALVPLARFEARLPDGALRERVRHVRSRLLDRAQAGEGDWRQWTWRNARRLAAARDALGDAPPPAAPAPWGRDCDGRPLPPQPAPPVPETAPEVSAPPEPPSGAPPSTGPAKPSAAPLTAGVER